MNTSFENSDHRRSITLQDIADQCGVSITTVSRALRNDYKRVGRDTIARVTAVARELNYDGSRQHAARRMALSRYGHQVLSHTLGLMLPQQHYYSNYFIQVFMGVMEVISSEDFGVHTTVGMDSGSERLPHAYRRGDIDGLLFLDQARYSNEYLRMLREDENFGQRPIVGLVDPIPGCSAVYSDHFSAGYAVAGHLLELGHQHVLHMHDEEEYAHRLRLSAYRQAYRVRDLDPDTYLHNCLWSSDGREEFQRKNEEWVMAALSQSPQVTAICARNDFSAVRIWNILRRHGWRVPEDISLISYDDTDPIIGHDGENILTTVHLPLIEVGEEATRMLIRRVRGEETAERNILLPTKLVVRNSTAPPRRKP